MRVVIVGLALSVLGCAGEKPEDRQAQREAQVSVDELANKAATQWRLENPGKACPTSVVELTRLSKDTSTRDPWGHEFVMLCGKDAPEQAPNGFGIVSVGPDGNLGTVDDVRSWAERR